MTLSYVLAYLLAAVVTGLASLGLAKRASDENAKQAFVFALGVGWPLTWALVVSLVVLVFIAALWLAATWPIRRAKARRNATP